MIPPKLTKVHAQAIAGAGIFILTLAVLGIMVFRPELAENDLFKSLAQAIVIQGLVGLAMAFLFTGQDNGKDRE